MAGKNKHSDSNFIKGFGAWLLFKKISQTKTLKDFLLLKSIDEGGREDSYKILRLVSFSVQVESELIAKMDEQFDFFDAGKKDLIRKEVLTKIKQNHRLKGSEADVEAERLLRDQLSGSEKIIIPPVLQYAAGYSMGGLINFARKHFSFSAALIDEIEKFKEARNYALHNPTSSRDDIDKRLDEGLKSGEVLMGLFNPDRDAVDELLDAGIIGADEDEEKKSEALP